MYKKFRDKEDGVIKDGVVSISCVSYAAERSPCASGTPLLQQAFAVHAVTPSAV